MGAYITLLGAPGSGKGTQTERLLKKYCIQTIGIGDIIRKEVKERTELGQKALPYIEKGDLVPDSLIIEMFKSKISKEVLLKGAVFDGFPRNLEQSKVFDESLKEGPLKTVIVYLDCHIDTLITRLLLRGREDDTPEVIRNRNEVFLNTINPILEYFSDRVIRVAADADPDIVFERICAEIDQKLGKSKKALNNELKVV